VPVMRKCREVPGCWVVGIAIAEDKLIAHSIVITVLDDRRRGLSDDELLRTGRTFPRAGVMISILSMVASGLPMPGLL